MREITTYICDKCGRQYDSYLECFRHEHEYHVEPKYYHSPEPTLYVEDGKYPVRVNVKMMDGAMVEYTYRRVIETPKQAESPCGNTDSPEEK